MSFDLAVIGSPFLDLTFAQLARVPAPGEELVAEALHISPGGTGMQAIAAARLGLRTALVAPIGSTGAAALVRHILERDGVTVVPDTSDGRVPVTALLSTLAGTAMATAVEGQEPTAAHVAEADADAVLVSLGRIDLASRGDVYAVTGTLEVGSVADDLDRRLDKAAAVIMNEDEAKTLTGAADPEAAARALASPSRIAVVTCGSNGAVAAKDEDLAHADAPEVQVADATGAGDVFAAAFVWAQRHGASLQDSVTAAVTYAALSVRAATALDGALTRAEFAAESGFAFGQ